MVEELAKDYSNYLLQTNIAKEVSLKKSVLKDNN